MPDEVVVELRVDPLLVTIPDEGTFATVAFKSWKVHVRVVPVVIEAALNRKSLVASEEFLIISVLSANGLLEPPPPVTSPVIRNFFQVVEFIFPSNPLLSGFHLNHRLSPVGRAAVLPE